jgi:hypothetical protein
MNNNNNNNNMVDSNPINDDPSTIQSLSNDAPNGNAIKIFFYVL